MKLKHLIKILIGIILIGIGCTFLYFMILSPNYIINDFNYSFNYTYRPNVWGVDIGTKDVLTFGLVGLNRRVNRYVHIVTENQTWYFDNYYFEGNGSELLFVKCPKIVEPYTNVSCKVTLDASLETDLKPGFYEGKLILKYKDKP